MLLPGLPRAVEDEITSYNGTALLHAAASGEPLIAKYLLWKGADIRKRTKHDESAFDLARPNRVLVCTARTLNATAQSRVTLHRCGQGNLRAALWVTAGGKRA